LGWRRFAICGYPRRKRFRKNDIGLDREGSRPMFSSVKNICQKKLMHVFGSIIASGNKQQNQKVMNDSQKFHTFGAQVIHNSRR
jgi:hypothetical protein